MKISEFFAITEETIVRDATDEELADAARRQEKLALFAQQKADAQAKREAALAKLEALGLDPDDFKALGLQNNL